MSEPLLDAVRHNSWASRRVLEFCRNLSDEQLGAPAMFAYGSVLETLEHLIGSESFYRRLFAGSFLDWNWSDETLPTVPEMEGWAADLASFWEELLSKPFDPEAVLRHGQPDGKVREVRAGVVLAQMLHHSNIHREQVSAVLASLGVEPPNLSVWSYAEEAGRDTTRGKG